MEPHDLALSRAKIGVEATKVSAFYTHLVYSLKHSFSDTVKTAGTNGLEVLYNINFFMGLDHEERVFLLCHEAMHCAYLHMVRAEQFDKQRYNVAADHVINLQLLKHGFKMPRCGHAGAQYKDLSAEEVYYLLPPETDGSGGLGLDLLPAETDEEELEQQMQDVLVQAVMQSQLAKEAPGSVPGDIELFVKNLLNPKLPWSTILRKYLQDYSKNDYSFKRPNRRFFPDAYLPSMHSLNLIDLVVAADISGSVSDTDFKQIITETHSMLRMMKPKKITLIQFDTQIKSVEEIKSIQDLMKIKFKGRGGTDIDPVLEWADKHKPQLLLFFTDGGFYFSGKENKKDTVWLIHNNPQFTAPFGKVIHYEMPK